MKKPWFWKARGAWYCTIGRSQVRLHEDEAEAYKIWQEMQSAANVVVNSSSLATLADNFLTHAKRTVSQVTYSQYSYYIAQFFNANPKESAKDLKAEHLYRWLDSQAKWGPSSKRAAITSIKRMFAWAVQEGILERNPMLGVKRPPAKHRDTLIDDTQHAAMMNGSKLGKAGKVFRQVLIALRHSGARPGTVAAVTAGDVSATGEAWVMDKHKTRGKTGKPLVVYLSPCLQALTRILHFYGKNRQGELFINSDGKPWTRNAIRCRMRRLRKKLGLPAGVVAYAYRHSWATRALTGGTDIATVAELLGHTSTDMVSRHYGHLDQAKEHLKKAAAGVIK